jgi:Leucine zipper with capping helix domain/Mnd1 HTH domain
MCRLSRYALVIQVSDGLVTMEKVGTSNYFWAFPSAALKAREIKVQDLTMREKLALDSIQVIQTSTQTELEGREDTDERTALLARLQELQQEHASLAAQLEQFKDCDPETYKQKIIQTKVAKDAANRWTENIFCLMTYARDKFMVIGCDADEWIRVLQELPGP